MLFRGMMFGLLLCLSIKSFAQTRLSYRFSMDAAQPAALIVELRMAGSDSGVTWVQLPDEWASQKQLYKAITGFTLRNKTFSISQPSDSSRRRIVHTPGEELLIQYRLQQDWTGPLNHPANYRAVINNEFIHATGHALLVLPLISKHEKVHISFDWSRMPKKWNIANSFHTGSRKFEGIKTAGELQESIFVAGDYRLHQTLIHQQPVHLAIRGRDWKFSDTALLRAIHQVIAAQRQFWTDNTEPYYLVTMTPFEVERTWNGSALHHSFLACLSPQFALDWNVYGFLSHEYFHRWNGVAMMMPGPEQENYWFSEGFTEYYTYKLLYRAGLMSLQEYVSKTNSTLAEYYLSPVRNADRKTMAENFWVNKEYNKLPYKKGFAYALMLDHLIGTKTQGRQSLDHFMFSLLAEARKGQMPTDSSFLARLTELTGEDLARQHSGFINDGVTIPIATGSMGNAVGDSLVQLSSFELGFDWQASVSQKKLVGVVENSAAWKAGLRNGQIWRGASVHFDNIALPAMVRIEEGGQIKEVNYQPVSEKKEWVRQFYVKQSNQ